MDNIKKSTKSIKNEGDALFQSIVRSVGGRWTKERETLLQIICNNNDHFSVDDVVIKLKKLGFAVADTTVYRNLALLVQAGIIRRACLQEESSGGAKYELILGKSHHDHLVCSRCGSRIDFFYPAIDILQNAVAEQYGFFLERHHLELVGVCPKCQTLKNSQQKNIGAVLDCDLRHSNKKSKKPHRGKI